MSLYTHRHLRSPRTHTHNNNTLATLFTAERTASSQLQASSSYQSISGDFWFPSWEPILTLTDRLLTWNFNSIFSFPKHLLLERVSQAAKKTCGFKFVCTALWQSRAACWPGEKSSENHSRFLRTPYGVPIKRFISTRWWSGSPSCLLGLCVIYDLWKPAAFECWSQQGWCRSDGEQRQIMLSLSQYRWASQSQKQQHWE